MDDARAKIVALLKAYPSMKRQIEQLRFELGHPTRIGEQEIIDSLSFGARAGGNARSVGYISNRTMTIAMQYQDVLQDMNCEVVTDIMQELRLLEAEVDRLEHYISMLDDLQATTIRLLYFEQKPWSDIEKALGVSNCTVSRYRKCALDELVRMYTYIDQVKSKASEDADAEDVDTARGT